MDDLDHIPDGVTIERKGNLYDTCYATNRIYKIYVNTREKEIFLEDRDAQLVASPTNCVLSGDDEDMLYYAHLNARFIGRVKIK